MMYLKVDILSGRNNIKQLFSQQQKYSENNLQ